MTKVVSRCSEPTKQGLVPLIPAETRSLFLPAAHRFAPNLLSAVPATRRPAHLSWAAPPKSHFPADPRPLASCPTATLQLTSNLLQPCPLTGHLASCHHPQKIPAPPPAGPCAPASSSFLPSLQPPLPWCPVKHLSPSSCSHSAAQSPCKRHCHPCMDPYTISPSPRYTATPRPRALHLLQLHSSHGAPQTLGGPPKASSPCHLIHTLPDPLSQGPAQRPALTAAPIPRDAVPRHGATPDLPERPPPYLRDRKSVV